MQGKAKTPQAKMKTRTPMIPDGPRHRFRRIIAKSSISAAGAVTMLTTTSSGTACDEGNSQPAMPRCTASSYAASTAVRKHEVQNAVFASRLIVGAVRVI